MAGDLEIRPVRPDEHARAGAVTMLAYQEFARPDRPGWVEYQRRIGDIAGRAGRTTVLVALVDGELVGSATVELDHHVEADNGSPLAPDEAHLRMLGVDPERRRQGIGRALVNASIALARDAKRSRVTLETTEVMRAAQHMYEAMGFTLLGRREVEPGLVFLDYELAVSAAPPPRLGYPPAVQYESGEKFLRVIQLFRRLGETAAGVTTKQLAEELDVTPRTVQRYVQMLRDSAGIDIEERDGRLRIGPGTRLPAMQLNRYQAALLLVALRLLQQLRPEHDPDLVGALAELSRALSVPLVARYLERTLRTVEARPLNRERREVERAVIDGFVSSRTIVVDYVDGAGRRSRRELQPYFLEPAAQGRHIYVFALDATSGTVRPFRLDRIRAARLLPTIFTVPDGFDIDRVVSASWGVWQSEQPDHVVLRFSEAGARLLREQPWHPNAEVVDLDAGGVEMRLDVASEVEMRPWVLGWGPLVTVVEPRSLRDYVADAALRISALYEPSPRS